MPPHGSDRYGRKVDRRRVLQAIGVASTAALAGCGQGDGGDGNGGDGGDGGNGGDGGDGGSDGGDGGSGNLGERVGTLTFQYWSDQGNPTVLFEETISQIQAVAGDLGFGIETRPMTTGEGVASVGNDQRGYHIAVNSHGPSPGRLDPDEMLTNYSVQHAGANGLYNPSNYASCEFSEPARRQTTTPPSERPAVVAEAMSVFSQDMPFIPTVERPFTAALNTDQLTEIEAGPAGLSDIQWASLLESNVETRSGTDAILANLPSEMLTSSFYPTVADGDALVFNTILTDSPLLTYNSSYELIPVLAEDWETNEEGTETTFNLRDGTFHNGDPITPEDVKWTYEFLRDQYHAGNYQWTNLPEDLTVEIRDDSTVAFVTENPAPQLLTARLAIYGVLPRDPYVDAGIEDNPTDFEDPMVGSGPYVMTSYSNQQNVQLEPHDGHPRWSPSAPVYAQLYESVDGVVRAFRNGELNLAVALHPEAGAQLEEDMGDSVQIINGVAHLPFGIMPQCSYAPGMFTEFRHALSNLVDREGLVETYAFGGTEPMTHVTFNSKAHPWYDEESLTAIESTTADVERAREILEEAGWGWDDSGNLHYPPDAEMEAWPQGETPGTDDFPCLG